MLKHLVNPKPKIAVLGTYLALYDVACPEHRNRMLGYVENILNQLSRDISVQSVGIFTQEKEVTEFINRAEQSEVDGLLVMSLGYTNSLAVVAPLVDTKLPLVLFNTQALQEVTAEFTMQDLMDNHGLQGIQDIACVLVRRKKPFGIVTGLVDQPDTRQELMDYFVAARAYGQIQKTHIAYMGDPMWGMGDTQFDHHDLEHTFGIQVHPLSPEQLVQTSKEVTQEQIDEIRHFDQEHFDLDPAVNREDHERSTRLEIGLRKIVEQQKLSGLTFSFDSMARFYEMETIPFLAILKLMAEGLSYGGEGDLLATAGETLARCLCGDVCFTEMYTIDFKANAVWNTHMAECNWKMARKDRKPILLNRQFSLAKCKPFLSLHFGLEPGEATLFDLTLTAEGKFHFIILECDIDNFPAVINLDQPNFKLNFSQDVRSILNEYSRKGGTHHLNLVFGHQERKFRILAKQFNCPYSYINTDC